MMICIFDMKMNSPYNEFGVVAIVKKRLLI